MASENARLLVSLTLSTVTRKQYVERSKERALALLRVGRIRVAVPSMMMDMRKPPDSGGPHDIHAFRISAAAAGDTTLASVYIEAFNSKRSAGTPCSLLA